MSLVQRQTELSVHVVMFSRFLRTKGFPLGPDREADALQALAVVKVGDEINFYLALRAVFPQNRKQIRDFDALYTTYWKELAKAVDSKIKDQETVSKQKKKASKPNSEAAFEALKNWLHGKSKQDSEEELAAYSLGESILGKDFSSYTDEDLQESQQVIRQLVQRLRKIQSRRYVATRKGGQLDLRHILRDNFRRGDEIVNLFYKKQAQTKIKIVLICDVSKSMDLYSRFFVQFMYAFQNLYASIETFVFSTKLLRITEDLKEMEFQQALDNLSDSVPNWSGGTDLGAAFREFVQEYALRKLNSKTVVLIVSDGWDTAESPDLAENMAKIKRKSRRVYWLNPLASTPNYSPEVRGLKAVMPHIDALLPAHNLESLKEVIGAIR